MTPPLASGEIEGDYEANTGAAIVRRFEGMDPLSMAAVLVAGHGPFCWGKSAAEAARNAALLEEVASIAYFTTMLNPVAKPISPTLLDKHFLRKHGPAAYYGQK